MEAMLERQKQISASIGSLITNFKKDGANRKTSDYLRTRLETLESLWGEYESNHTLLMLEEDLSDEYFDNNHYDNLKIIYNNGLRLITQTKPYNTKTSENLPSGSSNQPVGTTQIEDLMSQQRTNFRAFNRALNNIDVKSLVERWEIDDKLKTLNNRWNMIDELHWKIDNLLNGADEDYEKEFSLYEGMFETIKRDLSRKINNMKHQQNSTPNIEIPIFTGNYAQWTTFADLYREAIHENPTLNKAQKMQHLKGKLKGEPERIVQHLVISAENYDTCWDILQRRYNNLQLLFTKQMQTFMNQQTMQKHTAHEIKRLHDISLETVHAINNLGVDTTTWDPILVHIMTEKMDSDTYTAYMDARKDKRNLPKFDELIEFLEAKFTALEPLNSKNKHNKHITQKETRDTNIEQKDKDKKPIGYKYKAYQAKIERVCPLCKTNDHVLLTCNKFLNMTPETKLNTVESLAVCKSCLFAHSNNCTSIKRCKICNKQHHTIIHDVIEAKESCYEQRAAAGPSQGAIPKTRKANHVAGSFDEILLSTVLLKVRARDGTYVPLRCLLDQGSQINLITEDAAQRLGLERCNQNASVFGVGSSAAHSKGSVQLICESLNNNYTFMTTALVMPKVIGSLPNHTFEKPPWSHIQNINLADPEFNISRTVDILLDAKVYAEVLMDGILRGPSNAPIAQQTRLGWILVGNVKTFNCHAVLNNLEEISQFWEMEEITDSNTNNTPEQEQCELNYQQTTIRRPDGRYEVRLPMRQNFEQELAPSKPQAVAQFKQLERKFQKDENLSESYKQFIAEYEQLGHMKKCTMPREPSCYLPHHGVIRQDSETTKLRTVFNASNKMRSGFSLNDLMECGPNLQKDLQAMMLRWRTYKYVYSADIEKFYRQICITEEQQHLQKIVWRDASWKSIEDYQLCTVTYGTRAAPFLAMRTIKQLAIDDGKKYPLAVDILNNQLFVDDLLGGSNKISEAKDAQQQTINILRGGGFNLRKWTSNDQQLLEHLPEDMISKHMLDFQNAETNKTLGLCWNPRNDSFTFKRAVPITNDDKDAHTTKTKRALLSDISKIYDPLGWLSPITIKGKIIFQNVWTMNLGWDDKLPSELEQDWRTLQKQLPQIGNITIPRWIGNTEKPVELHGFCDSSLKAYSCVIYCKSIDSENKTLVRIIAAKTKLAPLNKTTSLPRLELSGALLLSRLMNKIIESTNIQIQTKDIYGWTDSMVVLGWLNGDITRWKCFVANRVALIQKNMPSTCWKHVKSEDNPADCASRGILPSTLVSHSLWWEGPEWLKSNKTPMQPTNIKTIQVPEEEERKSNFHTATITTNTEPTIIDELLQRCNSVTKVIRVLAFVSRFIYNTRNKNNKRTSNITINEIQNAHNLIIKVIQRNYFASEIEQLSSKGKVQQNSPCLTLNPFIDEDGILRVGGRLAHANLNKQQKHPIILPNKDRLSVLLINWAHLTTLHGGARLTLTYLRSKYWMLGGMNAVKRELKKCVKCLRFRTSSKNQMMADLPKARVTPSRPFTHTGVDFAGPVEVKSNKGRGIATSKGYVAIFICLATKAVHLELVSDLSSITFLAAFKRLCARRGTPKHMYSDCGTNFVGAANSLHREHQQAQEHYLKTSDIMNYMTTWEVEWHLNCPSWPSAGGIWEAAVKRMKYHLKRVIGEQKLTYEEFATLLTQIEACINSRPLLALTDSVEDLECLTPGHFLIGDKILAPPLLQSVESISLGTRWKLIEKMHKDFWRKWSLEYLQSLQTRSKWHHAHKNIEVGDVVIIREDNIPPAQWLLAKVIQTHPGPDGRVRVVTLKTKNKNEVKRPLNKLIILPVNEEPHTSPQRQQQQPPLPETNKNNEQQQQPKRKRRTVNRNSFNILACFLMMIFTLITTSMAQTSQQLIKVTTLQENKPFYFDKIADMQLIQDEWKMVVYYNLSSYWQNIARIDYYLAALNNNRDSAFNNIIQQLQHEVNELQQYNTILQSEHGMRSKRGLINGIGYVANSLFGVLDERFAAKYDKDIKIIQSNENHLNAFYKEQTSLIEGEYNILKRNEEIMNKQFKSIYEKLENLRNNIQTQQKQIIETMSAVLTANIIISHLQRVQQHLIDLVTDVRSGRMDSHLLTPEEFRNQMNIITGQVSREVTLPCVGSNPQCIREMYKFSRVHARLTMQSLLFEVKLPLISSEPFELNRVIPIPQITNHGRTYTYVRSTSKYAAINFKKDMLISITEENLQKYCTTYRENKLLCQLSLPIHSTANKQSTLCETQLINNNNSTACDVALSKCRNEWIKLQSREAWLFVCCQECNYNRKVMQNISINLPIEERQ